MRVEPDQADMCSEPTPALELPDVGPYCAAPRHHRVPDSTSIPALMPAKHTQESPMKIHVPDWFTDYKIEYDYGNKEFAGTLVGNFAIVPLETCKVERRGVNAGFDERSMVAVLPVFDAPANADGHAFKFIRRAGEVTTTEPEKSESLDTTDVDALRGLVSCLLANVHTGSTVLPDLLNNAAPSHYVGTADHSFSTFKSGRFETGQIQGILLEHNCDLLTGEGAFPIDLVRKLSRDAERIGSVQVADSLSMVYAALPGGYLMMPLFPLDPSSVAKGGGAMRFLMNRVATTTDYRLNQKEAEALMRMMRGLISTAKKLIAESGSKSTFIPSVFFYARPDGGLSVACPGYHKGQIGEVHELTPLNNQHAGESIWYLAAADPEYVVNLLRPHVAAGSSKSVLTFRFCSSRIEPRASTLGGGPGLVVESEFGTTLSAGRNPGFKGKNHEELSEELLALLASIQPTDTLPEHGPSVPAMLKGTKVSAWHDETADGARLLFEPATDPKTKFKSNLNTSGAMIFVEPSGCTVCDGPLLRTSPNHATAFVLEANMPAGEVLKIEQEKLGGRPTWLYVRSDKGPVVKIPINHILADQVQTAGEAFYQRADWLKQEFTPLGAGLTADLLAALNGACDEDNRESLWYARVVLEDDRTPILACSDGHGAMRKRVANPPFSVENWPRRTLLTALKKAETPVVPLDICIPTKAHPLWDFVKPGKGLTLCVAGNTSKVQNDFRSMWVRLRDKRDWNVYFCCGASNSMPDLRPHMKRPEWTQLDRDTSLRQDESKIANANSAKYSYGHHFTMSVQLDVAEVLEHLEFAAKNVSERHPTKFGAKDAQVMFALTVDKHQNVTRCGMIVTTLGGEFTAMVPDPTNKNIPTERTLRSRQVNPKVMMCLPMRLVAGARAEVPFALPGPDHVLISSVFSCELFKTWLAVPGAPSVQLEVGGEWTTRNGNWAVTIYEVGVTSEPVSMFMPLRVEGNQDLVDRLRTSLFELLTPGEA